MLINIWTINTTSLTENTLASCWSLSSIEASDGKRGVLTGGSTIVVFPSSSAVFLVNVFDQCLMQWIDNINMWQYRSRPLYVADHFDSSIFSRGWITHPLPWRRDHRAPSRISYNDLCQTLEVSETSPRNKNVLPEKLFLRQSTMITTTGRFENFRWHPISEKNKN